MSAYVTNVYQDLFGREPDAAGLATWTDGLLGGLPRVSVANGITGSDEYRATLIARAYRDYLGRSPDQGGAADWLSRMRAGLPINNLESGFLASDEAYAKAGGTDAAWVRSLYQMVLGRPAAAAEVQSWTAALANGMPRTQVANGFVISAEHLSALLDAEYQRLLRRSLDPAGRAGWVASLQNGVRWENVIGGIIASDEYYNRTAIPTGPWPDATTTGVPPGTVLTVHTGDIKVTQDGTVLDSLEIRGLVRIEAKDVVIKNSKITGRNLTSPLSLVYVNGPQYSVTIQDSEIFAAEPSVNVDGVIGQNFTLERVAIHHVVDQVVVTGDNVTVRSSWLHDNLHYDNDPSQGGTASHDDNVQVQAGRNILLERNRLESTTNAAIQVTQDTGVVGNVRMVGNYISQGACSVNLAQKLNGPLRGFVIESNTFTRTQVYAGCAVVVDSPSRPNVTLTGNYWSDGRLVTAISR